MIRIRLWIVIIIINKRKKFAKWFDSILISELSQSRETLQIKMRVIVYIFENLIVMKQVIKLMIRFENELLFIMSEQLLLKPWLGFEL